MEASLRLALSLSLASSPPSVSPPPSLSSSSHTEPFSLPSPCPSPPLSPSPLHHSVPSTLFTSLCSPSLFPLLLKAPPLPPSTLSLKTGPFQGSLTKGQDTFCLICCPCRMLVPPFHPRSRPPKNCQVGGRKRMNTGPAVCERILNVKVMEKLGPSQGYARTPLPTEHQTRAGNLFLSPDRID